MFDMVFDCKFCGRHTILGFHRFWTDRKVCWECRDKMISRHKSLLDKCKQKELEWQIRN